MIKAAELWDWSQSYSVRFELYNLYSQQTIQCPVLLLIVDKLRWYKTLAEFSTSVVRVNNSPVPSSNVGLWCERKLFSTRMTIKQPNLKLKTEAKQLVGSLPL